MDIERGPSNDYGELLVGYDFRDAPFCRAGILAGRPWCLYGHLAYEMVPYGSLFAFGWSCCSDLKLAVKLSAVARDDLSRGQESQFYGRTRLADGGGACEERNDHSPALRDLPGPGHESACKVHGIRESARPQEPNDGRGSGTGAAVDDDLITLMTGQFA